MTSPMTSMAAGRWLRGLGAAAALVALVVAVPWALLTWGHWPISGVPSMDQLRDLPSTVASDTAIIGAFTVALWVAWAVFVVCLVAEVVAEARGREASRVAALGPVQRLARHLVATIAMTVGWLGPLAGSSLPPPARPAAATTVTTVPSSPGSSQPATPAVALATASSSAAPRKAAPAAPAPLAETPEAPAPAVTVVVRAGDSPWALAQEHLGDGARWTEIWDLNRGAPQPDGRTWQSPETILPGWQLTLPAGSAATAAGAPMGADQIMVQPDDNPWTLAETHLGDGKRWRELFDANRGRIQSDGDAWLTESLVRPGWILTLPSATTPLAPPPPAPAMPAPAPSPAPSVPAPAPSAPAPDAASPSGSAPAPDAPAPRSASSVPSSGSPSESAPDSGSVPSSGSPSESSSDPGSSAPTSGAPSAPAPGSASTPATTPAPGSAPGTGTPSTPGTDRDAAPPPSPPTTAPEREPESPRTVPTNSVEEAAAPSDDDGLDIAPILVAGVPAVLAAGIVVRLDRIRRRRSRRLARGAVVPVPPPDLQETERRWRAIADHESADWVDTTLRYLTWAVRSTGAPVSVVGVRTGVNGLELLLSTPARQGAPRFAADESGWQWRLKCSDLSEIRGIAADEPPYTPGLVTLGTADDGSTVLVDVEQLGLTSVEGDATVVRAWLNGVALDVATAPWAGDVDLRLVGGLVELASLEQVTLLDLDAVPAAVEGAVAATSRTLGVRPSTQAARGAAGREPWPPLTIVISTPGADQPIVDVAAPARGAAVVAAGPVPRATVRLVAGADGYATLYPYGLSVRLSAVDARTAGDTARLLTGAVGYAESQPAGADQPDLVRTAPVPPATTPSSTEVPPAIVPAVPGAPAITAAAAGDADVPTGAAAGAAESSTDPLLADPSSVEAPALPEVTSVQPELAGSPASTSLPPPPPPPPVSAAKTARSATPWPAAPTSPAAPEADEDVPPVPSWAAPAAAETVDAADVQARYTALIRSILQPGEVEVVVLGSPQVTGWEHEPRQRSVEIVCYLAVHEGAVTGEKLRDCVFPPGFKPTSLRQAVSRTRTALGRSAAGYQHILPAFAAGSYELGPAVRSDYRRFQALVAAARRAPQDCEIKLLRTALGLVRAQPFSNCPPGGYGWASAEGISYALERMITDAAQRLCELALQADDARLAEWSARQGQRAVPGHEGLYRDLALAKLHQGDVDGFTSVRREAEAAAATFDPLDGLQPETQEFFARALARYNDLRQAANDR